MKNPKTIKATAAVLALSLTLGVTVLAASYDSSEDPLISLSYLTNIFKPEIEKEYRELYYLRENIEEAVAITAVPMSSEQKEKLTAKLEKTTGKKILLKNQIDKSLIGGVVLKIGNRQMDDSVKSRLEGVRRQIQGSLT